MASEYEEQWAELRVQWAKDKIQEWIVRLRAEESLVERRKLESDIAKMKLALRDWEA